MLERPIATETFGPDKPLVGVWLALVSIPALLFAYDMLRRGLTRDVFTELLVSLIMPVVAVIFVSRFRVSFTPENFIYRRWGITISVPYSEISHIEITNVTPIRKEPIGAFLVTRDGERLPFWPKLFPRRAAERFLQLV
jgi:hypothetical protein